jgi:hypothetical protein
VANVANDEVEVKVENMPDRGSKWISVNQSNFVVPPQTSRAVNVTVNVPLDALPDLYDISVMFTQILNVSDGAFAIGSTSCRIKFTVKGLRISSFYVRDVQKPIPAEVITILRNFDNTVINLSIQIFIYANEVELVRSFQDQEVIDANKSRTLIFTLDTSRLSMGNYTAKLVVTGYKTLYAEDEFIIGLLMGEVIGLKVQDVALGNPVIVELSILNKGNLPLNVTAHLFITDSTGRTVAKFEKDEVITGKYETYVFTWIPQKEGKYTAQANVWYGYEYAELKEIFDVYSPFPMIIIYSILAAMTLVAVVVMCTVYIIQKRRRLHIH